MRLTGPCRRCGGRRFSPLRTCCIRIFLLYPQLTRNCAAKARRDRKSTRLNSSHLGISYAVFCLKKFAHALVAAELALDLFQGRGSEVSHRSPITQVRGQIAFLNDTATTEIYSLSLHDALPI